MKRLFISAFLVGAILASIPPLNAYQAQLSSPTPPESTQVGILLAQANEYSQLKFDNEKAMALYAEALTLESENDEILWRMSRACVDIAEHMPAGSDEEKEVQLKMYEKALEYANRSVESNPNSSMSLTRRAVATGRVALSKGMWTAVGLMKEMREDLEKAIALDSSNHEAHFVLGKTHMRVIERPLILRWPLGLGWGSREEAIRNFETAIALGGDCVKYRLACARAHYEEDDLEKAGAHLTVISSLPILDRDDEARKKEAKDLLEKIRSEMEEE